MASRARARAQSLATVLVLELVDAVFRIHFDYEQRFAEHEPSTVFRHRSRIAHAYLARSG
jgi:hypothetical protein